METDSFFAFDTTIPPEDEEDLEYDEHYDALNDETFGSAAVNGDWEENHKQLSNLKDKEKLQRQNKSFNSVPIPSLNSFQLNSDDQPFGSGSFEKPRLFERNINLELSSSPGNSIWTPTHNFSSSSSSQQKSFSNNDFGMFGSPSSSNSLSSEQRKLLNGIGSSIVSPPPGLCKNVTTPAFQTVEEVEQELLKRQHSLPSFYDDIQKTKQSALTVEDIEKSLKSSSLEPSQQSNYGGRPNIQMQQHSLANSQQNNQHFNNLVPQQRQQSSHNNHVQQMHHQSMGAPGFRHNMPPFGNIKRNGIPFHPLLNAHPMQMRQGMPPNNMGHHPMGNGSMRGGPPIIGAGGHFNNHFNHRPMPNKPGGAFFPNNQQRNGNFQQNGLMERRNFEQHPMMRNNHPFDHFLQQKNERDHNLHHQGSNNENGHSNNRVRRDSDAEWEEWQRIRQLDEYAGLMTPREKNWLRNIQGMQLQTDNPYQDDYYFVMHSVKNERKREEEVIEINGLQMLLPDKSKDEKEYEPPKLENSLGKLQVASVNAPRKIIDLEVVHLDPSHPTTSLQRDMRKHRTILMHIEKMYDTMIDLDDLQRKIRALPDCPTRDSFRSKCRQLVIKLWNGLAIPHETFVQILCIKKGKALAAKLMGWVSHSEVEHILATVVQNLNLLSKKDVADKKLNNFWPIADRFFASLNAASLVNFGIMVQTQLKAQKNSFIPALDNQLGLSIVLALLIRGECLWHELQKEESWLQFVSEVATAFSFRSDAPEKLEPLLSVTLAVNCNTPLCHLRRAMNNDEESLKKTTQVLNSIENYFVKNTPNN